MKKFKLLIVLLVFFYSIAVILWLALDEIFYLYNFIIIGTSVGLGVGLWPVFSKKNKYIARLISQFLVGGYMFFGLGCGFIYIIFGHIMPENMQIEGFWFWLLSGMFMAGVIHYAIAKIIGPLIFNRAWCGWACWTAAVLDVLPWKYNKQKRSEKLWKVRYVYFFLTTAIVFILFFAFDYDLSDTVVRLEIGETATFPGVMSAMVQIPELWWFLGGNLLYYSIGIILAVALKDNRAFCKYICPVSVIMKVTSGFALLKVDKTEKDCIDCKICEKRCPMEVKILNYIKSDKRVSSTECILCQSCISNCPKDVLRISFSLSDKSTLRGQGK
ncbi:4Fe-4S binding protein [Prevotella sp. 10(H)]|uniref:4Fe-4S binding protein n=1 Tax=Prevotella sp. 10(H) TaxID=1158294 RepID=UPI00068F6CEF|nr:4Fe-4S binding protein [Prevotella sp. 10(H)]